MAQLLLPQHRGLVCTHPPLCQALSSILPAHRPLHNRIATAQASTGRTAAVISPDTPPASSPAQLEQQQQRIASASCSTDEVATSRPQFVAELSAACCSGAALPPPPAAKLGGLASPTSLAVLGAAALAGYGLKHWYDRGSRPYQGNVGEEYDAWAQEGVLEYYWGEHIHLGWYSDEELARGYKKKDFKQAKLDFVDEMLAWSGAQSPKTILDVGCGIGGTSRRLAKLFPEAQVKGITLSPNQVKRGTELAKEQGLTNVSFEVMDALNMEFEEDSFDLVWGCESGEHMPDKKKYVEAMTRVLKPGGRLVIACWCQREEMASKPFTEDEKKDLQFLYDEWAHPFFISIQEFGRLLQGTGQLEQVETADWTKNTIASWRHSNWVGVWDPWIVVFKGPYIWYKGFAKGRLLQYGILWSVKRADGSL
ncbi:hypothetical protein WJX72_011230 [[Myrmecia] bisecta]|uniref:Methyltransferase domain-containing protein n=1 Tax=[Myrmecia] bisecta TaxID=41462 RepID=A0AAW1PEY6_9CHLO